MHLPVRPYLSLLARYLRPLRAKVALLSLLLALTIGLQLYNPQIIRRFLDSAVAGEGGASLPWLALLFIILAVANQVITAFGHYLAEQISWSATNELRVDLTRHALKLDLSFHKSRTPGEMVERIDGDVNALGGFFSKMLIDLAANGILMAGVLVLLVREDWRAGLALGLFCLLTLWAMTWIRNISVPLWAKTMGEKAKLFGFVGEALAGTEAIRSSGAERHVLHRFMLHLQSLYRFTIRAGMSTAAMWSSSLLLFALGNALALGLGAWLYLRGEATAGTVYLIFYYTDLLRRPLEQIRTQLQELQKAGAAIGRVEELLQTTPQITDGPGAPIPAGALAVTFDGVSFGYEADDPVLQGISFSLRPGEVLGLLGRTGSGKSTTARLLLRLYDPTVGAITLSGVDLRAARLGDLRRRVGFVTQDVQLFAATVRENLTFFDPTVADARILAALDELGLRPWLDSLPQGLDTPLASGGGGLSAGEAQLLALARLFLADPGLVILDEASSRLDPATEAMVEQALARLLANRTAIIIAHRLVTVQRADRILILEDGRILEEGERARLAADGQSRFAQLLQTGLAEVMV